MDFADYHKVKLKINQSIKLCGSLGICLGYRLSMDQVNIWSGIYSAFNRVLVLCF